MKEYNLGEVMDFIKGYLESANKAEDDVDKEMGSSDGVENKFKEGDVTDKAEDVYKKTAAKVDIYESFIRGDISEEEKDLFLTILE